MAETPAFFFGLIVDNLLAAPSSFWVVAGLLLVLSVALRERPSLYAVLPVAAFLVMFCVSHIWELVETPPKVGYLDSRGELVPFDETKDAALTAALRAAQELILPAAELQGSLNAERLKVAVTYPELVNANGQAHKVYGLAIYTNAMGYVAFVVLLVLFPMRRSDLIGQMMFISLTGAETYTYFVNFVGCSFLLDTTPATEIYRTWGQTVATAACDREVGPWFETISMLLFVALMFMLYYRYSELKERFR